jgi:hypothetical protein
VNRFYGKGRDHGSLLNIVVVDDGDGGRVDRGGVGDAGVNLVSSARTGPRWKRKLVAAGLILLGIGVGAESMAVG